MKLLLVSVIFLSGCAQSHYSGSYTSFNYSLSSPEFIRWAYR